MFIEIACPDDYRACNNNECIQQIYFCDSWVDCIDGEDDLGCESELLNYG